MSEETKTDFERCEELFAFLQGTVPEGMDIKRKLVPKLTADQAASVLWYLGNQYWQVPDHIERCDMCGDLFDRHSEGDVLDYGKPPHFFCDGCMWSEKYGAKAMKNPDKSARPNA